MDWKKTITIGSALALISGTAALLADANTIADYTLKPYVETILAGQLEPLYRDFKVQSSKQANSEVNTLEFQRAFLSSKKAELEIMQKLEDNQLLREALTDIETQLQETQKNLEKARCDQTNLQAGIAVECSSRP